MSASRMIRSGRQRPTWVASGWRYHSETGSKDFRPQIYRMPPIRAESFGAIAPKMMARVRRQWLVWHGLICTTNLRNHCGVRRISGNLSERPASRDYGAAAQKESSADAVRRCTQNTLMFPLGPKTVDRIRCRRTRVAGIASQAEPRPSPHPRVLRASTSCICAGILALRCRGPMLAHALPGWRRRTLIWRYMTVARRLYGAPFLVAANGCAVCIRALKHFRCPRPTAPSSPSTKHSSH